MAKNCTLCGGNLYSFIGGKLYTLVYHSQMSEQQVLAYKKYLSEEYWNENLDWYTVLKYNNDITKPLLDGFRYMVEYGSFSGSLRCRWIYMINLDTNNLEVYKNGLEVLGMNSDIIPKDFKPREDMTPVLVGEFPLDNIPENWLEIVN